MRITRSEWALQMALLTAQRATCVRRKVGCVLLNARGHVLSTGYNGVAAGLPHCNHVTEDGKTPHLCSGACSPSGTNLDGCEALHAEWNAIMQCRDVHDIDAAYVTTSPCITCVKMLLNTSCKRIFFLEEYPHARAKQMWIDAGRQWEQMSIPDVGFIRGELVNITS